MRSRRLERICTLMTVLVIAAAAPSGLACWAQTTEPPRGETTHPAGMVVSGHPLATEAGAMMLREGGNAVDAAVATGFALAVVLPRAGNVGGGGFAVLRAPDGAVSSLDFREVAPLAATEDLYLDGAGVYLSERSKVGHLAVGVPGSVAGLLELHQRHGRLSLSKLLQPAISLATDGFSLGRRQARRLNLFRDDFALDAAATAYFTKADGTLWSEGDRFVQPDLAATLERIRDHGRGGFYEGRTADLIVASMVANGGLIAHEDLAAYEPVWREPVSFTYRRHRIISMAPPSSGGVALAQLFGSIEPYNLRAMGWLSPAMIHLCAEAMRRAYADRATWLGDPAFTDVPTNALMRRRYILGRMAGFDPNRITPSATVSHGTPAGVDSVRPRLPVDESPETTHYSVVDADGFAISLTTTVNDSFGAKVAVAGAGFLLNDEMDDFAAKPGSPNRYGLVGAEANKIEPGKRMLSSMTPTIIEDEEGRLRLVLGSPGGSRIITAVFETALGVIDFKMDVQDVVAAPRFHHQWKPNDRLLLELDRTPAATVAALEARGWQVREFGSYTAVHAIEVRYAPDGTATLHPGVDPRREGTSIRIERIDE
ncbi:MAG: gamma-glutamyltransferase [Bacteroidota bacterium]